MTIIETKKRKDMRQTRSRSANASRYSVRLIIEKGSRHMLWYPFLKNPWVERRRRVRIGGRGGGKGPKGGGKGGGDETGEKE